MVITAALTNALKVVGKKKEDVKIVLNGIGAAGGAAAKLLLDLGYRHLTLCDKDGILVPGTPGQPSHHEELAARTNPEGRTGTLADALVGADVFIGVSRPGLVTGEMVESMAKDPILLAMANPVPEIMPDVALAHGAAVVGTGRSDFPNQINNVLVFPGLFKGALSCGAVHRGDEVRRRPGPGGHGPPGGPLPHLHPALSPEPGRGRRCGQRRGRRGPADRPRPVLRVPLPSVS